MKPLRPMKAPTEPISDEQLKHLKYPVYGSPKLDGFRCVIQGGKALSNSLKPIPNLYVQKVLSDPHLDGLDGELVVGKPCAADEEDDVFNRTSGPLRRKDGEPDFTFWIFDLWKDQAVPYEDRRPTGLYLREHPWIEIVPQVLLGSRTQVLWYEEQCLKWGYEGIMLRSPDAPYKFGRCTAKEGYIFKRKPFSDTEAEIIGFEEQEENLNEKVISELGTSKRSSHKENKRPKGTLGKFILKSPLWEKPFACGTGKGLTEVLRKEIWENRDQFLGQLVTIKYQAYGSIDAPRQPIVKGLRDRWDLSEQ